jgi:hypothetical protein
LVKNKQQEKEIRNMTTLGINRGYSIEDLKTLVPSAFAANPKPKGLSQKYTFVPTDVVIKRIMDYGFVPVFAKQSRASSENEGYQKHMIRFASAKDLNVVQEERFELVMFNSHNGTFTYRFYGGFFRFVCENGLVVSSGGEIDCVRTKHIGTTTDDVVEASYKVIEEAPKYIKWAEELKTIELTIPEQGIFAESAYELLDENKKKQIAPDQLLDVRRHEDVNSDLWTTYNVVQENMLSGGLVRQDVEPGRRRARRTRAVNSIDGQVRLNVALSKLVNKMRELKS